MRGAVERLLDRRDGGIGGGLAQELHHRVEALVRVVDKDILGPNGGEAIAAEIADALGKARLVGRKFEAGAFLGHQRRQRGQPKHALDDHHIARTGLDFAHDESA